MLSKENVQAVADVVDYAASYSSIKHRKQEALMNAATCLKIYIDICEEERNASVAKEAVQSESGQLEFNFPRGDISSWAIESDITTPFK
jgi:hypothetical protein